MDSVVDPAALLSAKNAVLGVGMIYNPAAAEFLQEHPKVVDFLEVIPDTLWHDNGVGASSRWSENQSLITTFERVCRDLPVVLHSVGLSIGSAEFFDREHVEQIARWQQRFNCAWHSDHLSFNRIGESAHETNAALALPVPYDEELLEIIAARVRVIQQIVKAPFLLENNVYFFNLVDQEMTEPEFLNRLCHKTGCRLLLDVHNVYANSLNHGFHLRNFIDQVDPEIIGELHVAGGDEFQGMYTDSHCGPVSDPVWDATGHLLAHASGIRALTYEFHDSYYPRIGAEGVRIQLERARDLWEQHR